MNESSSQKLPFSSLLYILFEISKALYVLFKIDEIQVRQTYVM